MSIRILAALAAASALFAPVLATAAEDKWEITTKMEMVGMPFAMPGQTQTVCLPQNQPASEKMVPAQERCKVSGMKTTGSTTRFHVECPAPDKMSGDGEFTQLGKDAYKGTMAMHGVTDGEQVDMKMTYAGKKIGVCDAGKDKAISPTAIIQQQQAITADACREQAAAMAWQTAEHMAPICPTYKADVCRAAQKLFDAPASSDKALDMQEKRGDWKELAGYCGIRTASLTGRWCAMAKKESNWNNAAVICGKDPELQALAKKECTGKMYTAGLVDDKFQSLCELYADEVDPGSPPEKSKAAKAADTGKRAMEGVKKLKGLFGN